MVRYGLLNICTCQPYKLSCILTVLPAIGIQDAAGIVTCGPRGRLFQCKGNGMVRDVFDGKQLANLVGSLGVGHGKLSFV